MGVEGEREGGSRRGVLERGGERKSRGRERLGDVVVELWEKEVKG